MTILTIFSLDIYARDLTTVDTVRYRFTYAAKLSAYSPFLEEEDIKVEIGNRITYCYSQTEENGELYYEKKEALGRPDDENEDNKERGPALSFFHYRTLKHYPEKKMLTVTAKLITKNFKYKESIEKKNWKLESGDTTLLGYPCKKASCTFRGRTWNVWYTLEIPISEGPWKLDGLPGMILSASDPNGEFSFNCKSIEENVNVPMEVELRNKIKTTPKKLNKIRKLEFTNLGAYAKLIFGGIITNGDGIPYQAPYKEPILLEFIEK